MSKLITIIVVTMIATPALAVQDIQEQILEQLQNQTYIQCVNLHRTADESVKVTYDRGVEICEKLNVNKIKVLTDKERYRIY